MTDRDVLNVLAHEQWTMGGLRIPGSGGDGTHNVVFKGRKLAVGEKVEVVPASALEGAVAEADHYRLALVRVAETLDFESAYAAAIDGLRGPTTAGQSA